MKFVGFVSLGYQVVLLIHDGVSHFLNTFPSKKSLIYLLKNIDFFICVHAEVI